MQKEVKLIIVIILTFLSYFIPLDVSSQARIVFVVMVLAALLWVTEAIPLFLTSMVVTILLVLAKIFSFKEALTKFADPVLILLFGGFLIARAMQDCKLDTHLAHSIVSKIKSDKYVLLALMCVTAFLSMWISNTATTVVMIPIALGIVGSFKKMTNFLKATVLGIAYSANIGGVGTIIGSPPNAIVVSELAHFANIDISFGGWMIRALPLVIILIPLAWMLLLTMFPFKDLKNRKKYGVEKYSGQQKVFLIIFTITILLWLTSSIHGLSSSLISIMSATSLFLFGILKPDDLNRINYPILILFGGGLVLGSAMFTTGLSQYFAQVLASILQGLPIFILLSGVGGFSVLLSSFASNTATAAIIAPVLLPLASILSVSPLILTMLAGIAVSFNYMLPVGTPPNAIAYATGHIKLKDMLRAGFLLTVLSMVILVGVSFFW